METFGEIIGYLRRKKKLNQAEIADLSGISRATWSDYERNHTQPNFSTLIKIADFFGVSVDVLLGREKIEASLISKISEPKNEEKASPKASLSASLNAVQRVEEPLVEYGSQQQNEELTEIKQRLLLHDQTFTAILENLERIEENRHLRARLKDLEADLVASKHAVAELKQQLKDCRGALAKIPEK